MANPAFPPKKKHALNHSKLSLSAPCPTAKGKYSQLKWDVYMNNPRMVVKTNDPSEMDASKGFGTINANMDTGTFYVFLELLDKAIESTVEFKSRIANYNAGYSEDRSKPAEVVHVSDIWVGRDKDNQIFISIISRKGERPVIKFIFGPGDARFHKVYKADGTEFTKAELSVIYAKAYRSFLTEAMANVLVQEYTEPPKPSFKGGGYQKQNTQAPAEDIEEDLPF